MLITLNGETGKHVDPLVLVLWGRGDDQKCPNRDDNRSAAQIFSMGHFHTDISLGPCSKCTILCLQNASNATTEHRLFHLTGCAKGAHVRAQLQQTTGIFTLYY